MHVFFKKYIKTYTYLRWDTEDESSHPEMNETEQERSGPENVKHSDLNQPQATLCMAIFL